MCVHEGKFRLREESGDQKLPFLTLENRIAYEYPERAAEIIDEEGIEALTLRGIARDLGVSHGAPNRHFQNKAALLAALAADGWLKARDATLNAAENTGSHSRQNRTSRISLCRGGTAHAGWRNHA